MADLLYVVMTIVLAAIGLLFVIGCDKIVGPDEVELVDAAIKPSDIAAIVIACLIGVYLIYILLTAERL